MIPPIPANEAARLAALRRFEILDTPDEASFNRIARLVTQILDVPIALVSLADAERQWFKACFGLDVRETSREVSFCAFAILSDEVLVVPDATLDERFRDNPLVTGEMHVRFYAGAPLRTPDGFNIGSLCAIDMQPRELSANQIQALSDLAAMVVDELELRVAAAGAEREIAERKTAESALRESENKFRALIENGLDITTVLGEDGTILYESPSVAAALGYAPQELVGRNAFEFTHPDDLATVLARFGEAMQSDGAPVTDIGFRFRHKDGTWRDLEAIGRDARFVAGIGGIVVNSRDVTMRKTAERALRQSEANYRTLIENVNEIVYLLDVRSKKAVPVSMSEQTENIIGYSARELVEDPDLWFRLIHPDDFPAFSEAFDASIGALQEQVFCYRLRHKDGSYRWIEDRHVPQHDESGEISGIWGLARDVTQSKEAEEALRQSEETFKSAFTNSAVGLALIAPDGSWLQVNRSLCEITGYSESELMQTTFRAITHPDDIDLDLKLMQQLLDGEIPAYEMEKRYIHKDGHSVWILINRSLERRDDGTPLYFISQVQNISERNAAESALRESEMRQRSIVESSLDAIVSIDGQGSVLEWNPAAERIFGWSRDEALGSNMAELIIPPQLHSSHHGGIAHYIASGEGPILGQRIELPALRKDGAALTVELIVVPISGQSGPSFTGFLRDITEWREAGRLLEENEQRYKSLVENNADAVVSLDLEGRFLSANPAMERITGYSDDELRRTFFAPLVARDDTARVQESFDLVATGTPQNVDFGLIHKDGRRVELQVTGVPISVNNETVGVYAIARDVTEKRRKDERLRLLESVVVKANDAILITEAEPIDEPGPRILYANAAYTRMTGYEMDEIVGLSPRILHGPNTDRAPRDKIRAALKKWKPVVVEMINYRKDGTPFWVEISIFPVANETGWFTHWVSIQRDITERKKSEAALQAAKSEAEIARESADSARALAERANAAKSEFLSRMSHELRTPLNGILGLTQVLKMDELQGDHGEIVDDIGSAGKHLLSLINEVLDIARIEAGGLSMSPEPVGVLEIVNESLTVIAPLAAARDLKIVADEDGLCDCFVFADRQRLLQILLNLLSNAVKYNRVGGTVTLRCEDAPNGRLLISIDDTGFGIDAEKLERIFVPFDRLGADQSDVEGTGLGMALTKRLVEAMGGTMDVESTPEFGSTFSFALPRAQGKNAASKEAASAIPMLGDGVARTVLHIEDNDLNQKVVAMALMRRSGVTLVSATRGEEGLQRALASPPDIILLDLHLPDIGGAEVLQRLREDERTRALPIVILSADATSSQIERLLLAGADDYLTKPLDLRQFLAVLDKHLIYQ